MSFEVLDRDLMGRIGRLKTKSGQVETPILLPVVNPMVQPIPPREMWSEFGCRALFTNAYLVKKNFGEAPKKVGIHAFLDFPGIVTTDSGAYQILVYREIEATSDEIARYEEEIDTDIAVILDVPSGWEGNRERAEWTVEETLRRAASTLSLLTRNDILWIGPVQGGRYLDLIAQSARAIGKMPFQIYALGSPTQVMERYIFDFLVDMIMAAKENLPIDRPLHLFGAGHPFMLALAVALGCDLFDSAAYALYARQGRYMTDSGTLRLKSMDYFPCACHVCSKSTPKDLRQASKAERERLLARHNLSVCLSEMRRIKQAIRDGRLWELLELRARSHPSLLQALRRIQKYSGYLEQRSPSSKERGILYFESTGLSRPEIPRHRRRLSEHYVPPNSAEVLVLIPSTTSKPFHKSREYTRLIASTYGALGNNVNSLHVCVYVLPFGIVPIELDDVYPLSQFEVPSSPDKETIDYVLESIDAYLSKSSYRTVILHPDVARFGAGLVDTVSLACSKIGARLLSSSIEDDVWSEKSIDTLARVIKDASASGFLAPNNSR